MHPAYFLTRFRVATPPTTWPRTFAIISARATTGETWSDARNEQADRALESVLADRACWTHRITGFAPDSGHAEPGWAADVPLEEARRIGGRFAQDAVYWVDGDALSVTHCYARSDLVAVGTFRARLVTGTAGSGADETRG